MDGSLRVASYNVRDLKDDVAAAARVVRAIDPDVLCLQEVPRHPFSGHRVAEFAAALRADVVRRRTAAAAGRRSSPRCASTSGSARHERLPVRRRQRERGYAVASVALPGDALLDVVSVHLSLDADERARHAGDVLRHAAADRPLVVAGDLNEGEDGRAWAALAGRLRPVSETTPTFTARHPRHRLDVIFASGSLELLAHRPVDLDPADLVAASDHLPVWVDLDVRSLGLRAAEG